MHRNIKAKRIDMAPKNKEDHITNHSHAHTDKRNIECSLIHTNRGIKIDKHH